MRLILPSLVLAGLSGLCLAAGFQYEVIPNIFIQDDNATIPANVGAIPPRFGLIDSSPFRWFRLREKLESFNRKSGRHTQYKVVFFGRHGEGYHNVAEAFYGTPAWDETWSKLNGNGTIVWGPDAKITPKGVLQAQNATKAWEKELRAGIPIPEKIYSSPLSRASETGKITFEWLFKFHFRKGLILENLREALGVHTCDKRETKSYILKHYGDVYNVQKGFTEEDQLWTADHRETNPEMDIRTKKALDHIFSSGGTWISVTAHSGVIGSIFRNIGHRSYSIPTGGVVPVVLKATKV